MNVQLTAEQQARLSRLAHQTGRTPDELAREAVDRYLQDQGHYYSAVKLGQDVASREELVDPSEVWIRVERTLKV